MQPQDNQDRFVWPPRAVRPTLRAAPPSEPAPAVVQSPNLGEARIIEPKSGLRAMLRDIERTWLDVKTPSFNERRALASWNPDVPEAYCPTCGASVGPHEVTDLQGRPACQTCRGKRLPWDRTIRLGEYGGLLREVIHETKFTAWRSVGAQIGAMLGVAIGQSLEEAGIPGDKAVLVPMPTTFRRRMARGIDHALVLARGASRTSGCRIVRPLIRHHRPSQVSLPRSKRTANVAGTIRAHGSADFSGLCVIVIDDVKTTGATMRAACRAVKLAASEHRERANRAPDQVWTAILAVAADGTRSKRGSDD